MNRAPSLRTLSRLPGPISRNPSLAPTRHPSVQFLLKYYQAQILACQYFRYFDYSEFCTKTLIAMAESSEMLCTSIIAFSALVFSFKVHKGVRPLAFYLYSKALQELRLALGQAKEMTAYESNFYSVVASALVLASFDVISPVINADSKRYCGDPAKTHQHIRGVARVNK
jgi:hypothetical protein